MGPLPQCLASHQPVQNFTAKLICLQFPPKFLNHVWTHILARILQVKTCNRSQPIYKWHAGQVSFCDLTGCHSEHIYSHWNHDASRGRLDPQQHGRVYFILRKLKANACGPREQIVTEQCFHGDLYIPAPSCWYWLVWPEPGLGRGGQRWSWLQWAPVMGWASFCSNHRPFAVAGGAHSSTPVIAFL